MKSIVQASYPGNYGNKKVFIFFYFVKLQSDSGIYFQLFKSSFLLTLLNAPSTDIMVITLDFNESLL